MSIERRVISSDIVMKRDIFAASNRRTDSVSANITLTDSAAKMMTVEDVKRSLDSQHISWASVAEQPRLISELLTDVAQEVSKKLSTDGDNVSIPPSLLQYNEIATTKLPRLGGKTIKGLGMYFSKQARRGDVLNEILKASDIVPKAQDINIAQNLGRQIYWKRFYGDPLRDILEEIAEGVEKPVCILNEGDFIAKNMGKLYSHASTEAHRGERSTPLGYLREKAGIVVSVEDIVNGITQLKDDEPIPWKDLIPTEGFGEFIEQAAQTIDKPIFLWKDRDFGRALDFINGRNLNGLRISLYRNNGDKETLPYLIALAGKKVTIEDVIWAMKLKIPFWGKVPSDTKKELIEGAAQEKGISPLQLNNRIFRSKLDLLKGRSLAGLYEHTNKKERNKRNFKQNTRALDIVGILILENNITITSEDIAVAMEEKLSFWARVPQITINTLLDEISRQSKKPLEYLTQKELKDSVPSLHGRSLGGYYSYINRENNGDMNTMQVIRKNAGIKEPTRGQRNQYRLKKMQESFRELSTERVLTAFENDASQTHEAKMQVFLPWIESVANMYKQFYPSVPREIMVDHLYVLLGEAIEQGTQSSFDALLFGLNAALERNIRSEIADRSKRSLSEQLGETTMDLGDSIAFAIPFEEHPEEIVIFQETITKVLHQLKPLYRFITACIYDGQSFDQITEEINNNYQDYELPGPIDSDATMEYYDDALTQIIAMRQKQE